MSRIARLACLIHAASVHSEPGSNSPSNRIPPTNMAGTFEVNRSSETPRQQLGVGSTSLNCQRALWILPLRRIKSGQKKSTLFSGALKPSKRGRGCLGCQTEERWKNVQPDSLLSGNGEHNTGGWACQGSKCMAAWQPAPLFSSVFVRYSWSTFRSFPQNRSELKKANHFRHPAWRTRHAVWRA